MMPVNDAEYFGSVVCDESLQFGKYVREPNQNNGRVAPGVNSDVVVFQCSFDSVDQST